ncbi:hypothetical protein [Gilliamella apicola]|uniref:hypothetical protein n=1 Tax=Gilliamella apicola TaxID=1196095 RepID=UPI003985D22A
MKKIKYTLLFTCSLSLVGCFESSSLDRWIDNPTTNEIKLTIDGNELTIPAQSGMEYKFDYGKHTLTYNNDSLNFIVKPAKFGTTSFINPTQSNYFINTVVYSTSNMSQEEYDKVSQKELKNLSVIVDGEQAEIELPTVEINDVFIDRSDNDWDFSFDESFPEELTQELNLSKNTYYFERKRKLYREVDFLDFLKSDGLEEAISFSYQPKKFTEITKHVFPNIDLTAIKCEAGQTYMKKLLDDWHDLFTLKGGDFVNAYNKLTSDDASHKNYESEKLCNSDIDPDGTYHKALTEFINVIHGARDVHFLVIKS